MHRPRPAKTDSKAVSHHQFFTLRRSIFIFLLLDLLALFALHLATCSPAFANAYAHYVYRVLSLGIGSIMGLVPFSVTEFLLYGIVLFLLCDFLHTLYLSLYYGMKAIRAFSREGIRCPCANGFVHAVRSFSHTNVNAGVSPADQKRAPLPQPSCFRRSCYPLFSFIGHLFLMLSVLLVLYVFLCGINYHRTSFSEEAGISVNSGVKDASNQEEELIALCRYLVTEINQQEAALETDAVSIENTHMQEPTTDIGTAFSETSAGTGTEATSTQRSTLPVAGAYIGQNQDTPKPSMQWLFQAGHAGQRAMEKLGQRYPRLAGHYPFPKPILNSWILSVQQTTGVYSPFTVEANYNRDIPYYDLPFTICHELSHLRGYMQEEEANFIAVLATIGADDAYYNYSGYASAWVYAGNALARVDADAFATLYGALNARTRQDLLYNNQYWQQFEGKPAEAHEKVNDAYLKAQGQVQGTASYGHVTDLMLAYFAEHGTLK